MNGLGERGKPIAAELNTILANYDSLETNNRTAVTTWETERGKAN